MNEKSVLVNLEEATGLVVERVLFLRGEYIRIDHPATGNTSKKRAEPKAEQANKESKTRLARQEGHKDEDSGGRRGHVYGTRERKNQ